MKMEKEDGKSRVLRGICGVRVEKEKSLSIKTRKEKREEEKGEKRQ
jgi:hypothetical protein